MTVIPTETYRSTEQVIAWLGERGLRLRPQTLVNWRHVGGGPVFHRFGHRVVYSETELQEWLEARLGPPLRSTSERLSNIQESASPQPDQSVERGSAAVVGQTNRASAQRATVGTRSQLKRSP